MKRILSYKKSAALLIVLVLVAVISLLVAIAARSAIASSFYTLNTADNMSAEEASKAGIEFGLLQLKNHQNFNGDIPLQDSVIARVSVDLTTGVIDSIGIAGRVQKEHKITRAGTDLSIPPVPDGIYLFTCSAPKDCNNEDNYVNQGKFLETSIGFGASSNLSQLLNFGYYTWTTDVGAMESIASPLARDNTHHLDALNDGRTALKARHPEIRRYLGGNYTIGHLWKGGIDMGKFVEASVWLDQHDPNTLLYSWSWTTDNDNNHGEFIGKACTLTKPAQGYDTWVVGCLKQAQDTFRGQGIEVRLGNTAKLYVAATYPTTLPSQIYRESSISAVLLNQPFVGNQYRNLSSVTGATSSLNRIGADAHLTLIEMLSDAHALIRGMNLTYTVQ